MTTVINVAPALLLSAVDWRAMFSVKVSLLELFVQQLREQGVDALDSRPSVLKGTTLRRGAEFLAL